MNDNNDNNYYVGGNDGDNVYYKDHKENENDVSVGRDGCGQADVDAMSWATTKWTRSVQ